MRAGSRSATCQCARMLYSERYIQHFSWSDTHALQRPACRVTLRRLAVPPTLLPKQAHHPFEAVVPRESRPRCPIFGAPQRRSCGSGVSGIRLLATFNWSYPNSRRTRFEHGCDCVKLSIVETVCRVIIDVSDSSSAPALLRSADPDALRGRGLAIVAALAHGWRVGADGCAAWAEFRRGVGAACWDAGRGGGRWPSGG